MQCGPCNTASLSRMSSDAKKAVFSEIVSLYEACA
jgi:hypothetical protein